MKGKIKILYKLYKDMEELDPSLQSPSLQRRGAVIDTASIASSVTGSLGPYLSLDP